jgi:hypothetical protein
MGKYNYLKIILPVIIGLGFCIIIYRFVLIDSKKPIIINKIIGIKGKVTGINKARGFKIFINDSENPYNFDKFSNTEIGGNDRLGYYLDFGDSIDKGSNSDTLKLNRNGKVSFWYYQP